MIGIVFIGYSNCIGGIVGNKYISFSCGITGIIGITFISYSTGLSGIVGLSFIFLVLLSQVSKVSPLSVIALVSCDIVGYQLYQL